MVTSLENISDVELTARLTQLVAKEKRITHRVIHHLAEFDRRRLYAELGYTSLFDYATRGLGYSGASAQRRIKAARAMIQVPDVYNRLEDGKLSISVLEVAAETVIKKGPAVLEQICGKTQDEAARIIARFQPVAARDLADKIIPVVGGKRERDENQPALFNSEGNSNYYRSEVTTNLVDKEQTRYRVSFTASEELTRKLKRAKHLLFAAEGNANIETILDRVLEEFLCRRCPNERRRRRIARKRRQIAKEKQIASTNAELIELAQCVAKIKKAADEESANERVPSAALRDEVLVRDGNCCSYIAPDGTRCGCPFGLEIDHIVPWALGGKTVASNLRTLCRAHNMMFAREAFGDAHMERCSARVSNCSLLAANETKNKTPAALLVPKNGAAKQPAM